MLRFITLGKVRSTGVQSLSRGLPGSLHSGNTILRLNSTLGGSSTRMFRNTGGFTVPYIVPGTINEAMTASFWPSKWGLVKPGELGISQSVLKIGRASCRERV